VTCAATQAQPAELDAQGRRLLWRCRRGMKELDVLLEKFARRHMPAAGSEERALLARFLELPDPVLADYLLWDRPPDPAADPAEVQFGRLARQIASTVTEPATRADNC
jgi:antitoxin CptB